jgi:enamine deaminase RidA (YjgF/YER057c/UK114 family)
VTGLRAASAPVSQIRAVRVAGASLVFMSGQVAIDSAGRLIGAGDIQAQLALVYRNIKDTIESAGGGMADVVRLQTFLARGTWPCSGARARCCTRSTGATDRIR